MSDKLSLEEYNKKYLDLKLKADVYKTKFENIQAEINKNLKDKEKTENALVAAKKTWEKRKIQEELNKITEYIATLNEDLDNADNERITIKQETDKMVEEIKLNPDIREQCEKAMDEHTKRKIDKFEKQKQEQEKKKTILTELNNLIKRHPQAQATVKNIEDKSNEISKKEIELDEINKKIEDIEQDISNLDPADKDYASKKASLENDRAKLSGDKTKLEGENNTLKNERQAERTNLKKLFNNPKFNEYIDNITTMNSLEKDIKNSDRLIRRSENKIKDYEQAKERTSIYNAPPEPAAPLAPVPTKWETFKSNFKSIFKKRHSGDPSKFQKIGKTFKDLFKKSKPQTTPTTLDLPESPFKDDIKVDNAFQYEVVKEYYKSMNKEVEKQLKENSEERNKQGSSR